MFGLSCPQQEIITSPNLNDLPQRTLDALSNGPGAGVTLIDGEDCETIWEASRHAENNLTIVLGLNLNVITPVDVRPGLKLPVVVVGIWNVWNFVTGLMLL